MNLINDLLRFEYLQNAYLVGMIIGILAPIVGIYIVTRKLSLISDAISHITIGGISFAYFLNKIYLTTISTTLAGSISAIIGALLIEKIRENYNNYKEIAIPIIMSFGMSISVIFASLSNGFSTDFTSYLFGSILTTTRIDVLYSVILLILLLIFVYKYYYVIMAVSIDESYAKYIGINNKRLKYIIIIFVALFISFSIKLIGTLLISSLIILPVSSAMNISKSFKNVVLNSIIISELSILIGMILSYYMDLPSGATIVLLNLILYIITIQIKKRR